MGIDKSLTKVRSGALALVLALVLLQGGNHGLARAGVDTGIPGGGVVHLDADEGGFLGDAVELICVYDWPCGEALAVWYCESRGDWGAYSQGNYGGFQINEVHAARVGGVPGRLFDPATNVAVAYDIWGEAGWGPWACKPFN